MANMTADLQGRSFRILGGRSAVVDDVAATLSLSGAHAVDTVADIAVVSLPLLPDTEFLPLTLDAEAEAMAQRGGGRIVILLSAMASVPMRRHPGYSAAMAAANAQMRALAMNHAPHILVNAVGCGTIAGADGELVSGDRYMLTHLAIGSPGIIEDISSAVLFLCDPQNSYTTGQMLMVDGGWSPGYGRNF